MSWKTFFGFTRVPIESIGEENWCTTYIIRDRFVHESRASAESQCPVAPHVADPKYNMLVCITLKSCFEGYGKPLY